MDERGDATGRQPSTRAPWSVGTHLALIVGVAAVAIVAATAYGYLWNSAHSRHSAKNEMTLEARRAAELISKSTAASKQTVAQLSAQPGLDKAFTPAGAKGCQLSVEGSEAFPSMRLDIVSAGGHVACSSKPSPALTGAAAAHRGSAWLRQALHTNGPAVTWRGTDVATHQPAVVVTAPVKSGGKPLGVVALFGTCPKPARRSPRMSGTRGTRASRWWMSGRATS